MPAFRVPVAIRTGWLAHLSAARLAGMPATRLAQHHSPPQVAHELAQLLGPGHWLVEVGQELTDRAPSCHIASPRFVLDERPAAILFKGYSQFLLGVHHDGAIPGNRLADGFSGYQEEPDRFILG
jgi:hypothetical protein